MKITLSNNIKKNEDNMNQRELLYEFEEKYDFLYKIQSNGVPIYAGLRDGVAKCLLGNTDNVVTEFSERKGHIYPKRILDSFFKLHKFCDSKTLVFTSTVFRRDKGRNLAAEYLMERYSDTVVFEWPGRTDTYDYAYFSDQKRDYYCPLDFYLVCYKFYAQLHKKKFKHLVCQCKEELSAYFASEPIAFEANEQTAVAYIMENMPESYATTVMSQKVFKWLFRHYKHVEQAVDFWGSARENIIPVLPSKPKSIELQHGIITAIHPGYLYPDIAKGSSDSFFGRTLLVYGEKTKKLLMEQSIFCEEQIEIIGNPRIQMYNKCFELKSSERKLILFTSQCYGQDEYYHTVLPFLKEIEKMTENDSRWNGFKLGIKLHPRENNGVIDLYKRELPRATVYGNSAELYQLLCESFIQVTVSSTSLYEAAIFGTPTVIIRYNRKNLSDIYGFEPRVIERPKDVPYILSELLDSNNREYYLCYLQEKTNSYMKIGGI